MTVFPWTDLSIGTWQCIASLHHNLIAYTCEGKRCLTWIVRTGCRSFKMEAFYEHILNMRFANIAPRGVSSRIGTTRR